MTFSSSWSSFTSTGMSCISRLFLLVCWSCLFETFYNSNNLASRFSHFIWSLKLSSLSASIVESFTFDILWVTISCTDFVKFFLIYFNWSLNIIKFTINTTFDLINWRLKARLQFLYFLIYTSQPSHVVTITTRNSNKK